jgi:hypothetical protein
MGFVPVRISSSCVYPFPCLELWIWYFRAQFAKLADEVCANARFGLG